MPSEEKTLYKGESDLHDWIVRSDFSGWVGAEESSSGRISLVSDAGRVGNFDAIRSLQFHPVLDSWACLAEDQRKAFLVTSQGIGARYTDVQDLLPTPDGWIHRAEIFGKQYLLVRGQEAYKCDEIRGLSLASDGAPLFAARHGRQWRVVHGIEEEEPYDFVGTPVSGPDGRIAYAASHKGASFVVADGLPGKPFDAVGDPIFAGSRVTYTARKGEQYFVEGEPSAGPFEAVERPISSPSGRRAFACRRGGRWWVQVGERTIGPFELAVYLAFSPEDRLYFVVESGGKRVLHSEDGAVSSPFDEIFDLTFYAPGQPPAFTAREKNKRFIVYGALRSDPFDLVEQAVFTARGIPCFLAKEGRSWLVVAGRNRSRAFSLAFLLGFARDGSLRYSGAVGPMGVAGCLSPD